MEKYFSSKQPPIPHVRDASTEAKLDDTNLRRSNDTIKSLIVLIMYNSSEVAQTATVQKIFFSRGSNQGKCAPSIYNEYVPYVDCTFKKKPIYT